MNKASLVAAISSETGMTRVLVREVIERMTDEITKALENGEEVRIVGFGAFVPINRPAGPTRNPRTGKMVHRDASRTVRFKMGEALKAALN